MTKQQKINILARWMGWRRVASMMELDQITSCFPDEPYWVEADPTGEYAEVPVCSIAEFDPFEQVQYAVFLIERVQEENPGWRFSLLGGDRAFDGYYRAEFFGHIDPYQNTGQRHVSVRALTVSQAIAEAVLHVAKECVGIMPDREWRTS